MPKSPSPGDFWSNIEIREDHMKWPWIGGTMNDEPWFNGRPAKDHMMRSIKEIKCPPGQKAMSTTGDPRDFNPRHWACGKSVRPKAREEQ